MTDLSRSLVLLLMCVLITGCAPETRPAPLPLSGTGRLVLTISGFRNDRGEALIYLYAGAAGFPQADAPGLLRFHHAIQQGRVQMALEELPFGGYAISVLHDENRDGQMNKSPLGFPREGFGFSRNPDLLYGPPDYRKVRFLFLSDPQRQTIEMQYQTLRKKRPPGARRDSPDSPAVFRTEGVGTGGYTGRRAVSGTSVAVATLSTEKVKATQQIYP